HRRPARAAPAAAAIRARPARDGLLRGHRPVPDRGRVQGPGPTRDLRAERTLVRAPVNLSRLREIGRIGSGVGAELLFELIPRLAELGVAGLSIQVGLGRTLRS